MSYAYNDSYNDSYYENTPSDFGWIHESDIPDLEECKNLLQTLIDAVYTTGNIQSLESAIEDLASQLDVEMPSHDTSPVLIADTERAQPQLFPKAVIDKLYARAI